MLPRSVGRTMGTRRVRWLLSGGQGLGGAASRRTWKTGKEWLAERREWWWSRARFGRLTQESFQLVTFPYSLFRGLSTTPVSTSNRGLIFLCVMRLGSNA
jgi:hypothetical protein